jgi:uncharacterized protein YdbL (DUF1318 family)
MIRRLFVALSIGMALAAGAASAQTAAEKATVDAAKAAGVVGEQGDGYLGLVSGSADAAVTSAMADINSGRAKAYQDIAGKTGVTPQAAGEATAVQLVDRLPPGAYYKPVGGGWTRK